MNLKSLYQFTLYHLRPFIREPATLFWSFGFPLIATVAFALTFSSRGSGGTPFILGMYKQPAMEPSFLKAIQKDPDIKIVTIPNMNAETEQALMNGGSYNNVNEILPPIKDVFFKQKVDVIYIKGKWLSTRNPALFNSIKHRLVSIRELAKNNSISSILINVPGIRFVDWFIPGMIGLTLLSSGIFGIATRISANRERGLFKRLRLAPNSKTVFILGLAIARGMILFSEIIFLLLCFKIVFSFQVQGSYFGFLIFGMLAALTFCLLGAAVASRLKQTESAAGVANLFFMTMMFLSGVYFKIELFPDWLQKVSFYLPLTALNNGFRAIANQGMSLGEIVPEITVLCAWSLFCSLFTWKYFDWGTDL